MSTRPTSSSSAIAQHSSHSAPEPASWKARVKSTPIFWHTYLVACGLFLVMASGAQAGICNMSTIVDRSCDSVSSCSSKLPSCGQIGYWERSVVYSHDGDFWSVRCDVVACDTTDNQQINIFWRETHTQEPSGSSPPTQNNCITIKDHLDPCTVAEMPWVPPCPDPETEPCQEGQICFTIPAQRVDNPLAERSLSEVFAYVAMEKESLHDSSVSARAFFGICAEGRAVVFRAGLFGTTNTDLVETLLAIFPERVREKVAVTVFRGGQDAVISLPSGEEITLSRMTVDNANWQSQATSWVVTSHLPRELAALLDLVPVTAVDTAARRADFNNSVSPSPSDSAPLTGIDAEPLEER